MTNSPNWCSCLWNTKWSTTVITDTCNHFIIPTNAHNVKHLELLKHVKIMEAAATCFGLQRNHHQGATASTYYAAIALTTSVRHLYLQ